MIKSLWLWCILSAALGSFIGYYSPFIIASAYDKLFSVAILTGLESVFCGVRLILRSRFDARQFMLNFFVSIAVVVSFVFAGESLGLDLYYVALLAIGFRLLQDLDIIKVHLFNNK